MKVKAAVLYEVNKPLVVEEVDLEGPGPGEVLVRIVGVGLCHSDLNMIEGLHPIGLPVVLGHEGAGIVEEVGEGVTTLSVGDHVAITGLPYCGKCWYCLSGQPVHCQEALLPMMTGVPLCGKCHLSKDGVDLHHFLGQASFAEKAVVAERSAIKVREDVPLDKICLLSCAVATGLGAVVHTAQVELGANVVIIGCGGIGLSAVQGAVLAAAAKIVAVDVVEKKLEFATQFGATHTINASQEEPIARALEITGGRIDYAFEATGKAEAMALAFNMVRPGGTAVAVGAAPLGAQLGIDAMSLVMSGKTIKGSMGGGLKPHVHIPAYVELYREGRLKLDEMVTQTLSLDKINEGFEAMKKGEVVRSVVVF